MDISQLKYFISAAGIGNFTLAAEENNISQSSFSKQIMNLEDELGVKLFSRKKKGILLTPAGKEFLEYAHKMVSTYNDMLNTMDSFSSFQTYPVNIFSIPVILPYSIEDAFFKINREYPDLVISINELAESSYVLQALRRGECDFAILRTDFLDEQLYDIYPIIEDRLVVVVPEKHPLAEKEKVSLAEFKNEYFVMPPKDTDLRTIGETACLSAGFRPNIRYITSGNVNLTLKIIAKQNMIYLSFENVIDYYDMEGCKIIPLKENIVSSTAFVAEKKAIKTVTIRNISRFLEKEYGKNT